MHVNSQEEFAQTLKQIVKCDYLDDTEQYASALNRYRSTM